MVGVDETLAQRGVPVRKFPQVSATVEQSAAVEQGAAVRSADKQQRETNACAASMPAGVPHRFSIAPQNAVLTQDLFLRAAACPARALSAARS